MTKIYKIIGDEIYDIYIGKNAKDNWRLIDNAELFDLWFHIEDIPSAHIIVKQRNIKNEIFYPNQLIYEVASILKNISKYKNNYKIKIIYTEVKNIKKGKEIGSVYTTNTKSILI